MRRILHIVIALCLIASAGCEKKLPLPDVKTEKKVVLLGELAAGDSIYIRAGQSLPLTSQSHKFEVINGLTISMEEENGMKYVLSGIADSMTNYLYTIPFTSTNKIKAGAIYKLSTSHSSIKSAYVSVVIPAPFKSTIADTATVMYAKDTTLRVNVNINDIAGENYYVVEALKQLAKQNVFFMYKGVWLDRDTNRELYDSLSIAGEQLQIKIDTVYTNSYIRHGIYTKDVIVENARYGNQYSVNKRILIKDNTFSSGNYKLEIFVRKNEFLRDDRSDKGRTIIIVKSVTEEYFKYLSGYEQNQNGENYGTTTYPEQIKGNVQDGLGVVGGVYQIKFYYQLDSYDL